MSSRLLGLLRRPLRWPVSRQHPLHDAGGYRVDASCGLAILAHLPFADGLREGVEDGTELGLGEAQLSPGALEFIGCHQVADAA